MTNDKERPDCNSQFQRHYRWNFFKNLKLPKGHSWELIPLLAIKTALLFSISFMCYHRMFVTTIDVTLRDYHRFEIPSVPRFFDLRNPRVLKLWYTKKLKPAIHLDNRYRLMRHEPMLDADGKETDEIGEDDSIDIEELLRQQEKAPE
ncbi:uncharacterized protein LOC122635755 [Vespula pensylvanica]|uniref:uncharacterized protein LOC122635755 n=1 Tax=Vespula pensylvanica TaxID=30213 RepID=UPI001CB9F147|nr:uncharacterized protein LOC122635755 [Vespula pensylvanica]